MIRGWQWGWVQKMKREMKSIQEHKERDRKRKKETQCFNYTWPQCSLLRYSNIRVQTRTKLRQTMAIFTLPGWSDSNLIFFPLNVTQICCYQGCVDAEIQSFPIRIESLLCAVLDWIHMQYVAMRHKWEWSDRFSCGFLPILVCWVQQCQQ